MNDEPLSEYIAANFYVNDRVVDGVRGLESALTEARAREVNSDAVLHNTREALDRQTDKVLRLERELTEAHKQDARMPELERALDDAEVRAERWAHRCRGLEDAVRELMAHKPREDWEGWTIAERIAWEAVEEAMEGGGI